MPIVQYPANTQGNYGNERLQASGSPFLDTPGQAPTALNAEATIHLQRFIFKEIMGTDPEPYFASLKLSMFNGSPDVSNDDIYQWIEKPSQRYAPTADDGATAAGGLLMAAQAGVVGDFVQGNIPVNDSDYAIFPTDNDVMFLGGGFGTVISKTPRAGLTSAFVTVQSLVSAGLPQVNQGDRLPLMGELRADEMERIANVQRIVRFMNLSLLSVQRT